MTVLDRIMSQPVVYRLWQAPFADKKLAPVLSRQDMSRVRRVLDVACGPGTNAGYFSGVDYVGVDINDRYIATARSKHGGQFHAADAIKWAAATNERFDFILVNSFLHHLDDQAVRELMQSLRTRLEPGGKLHILELVRPPSWGIARTLAYLDRGKYARPLDEWRSLLGESLRIEWFHPYDLSAAGVPLWHMVYAIGGVES